MTRYSRKNDLHFNRNMEIIDLSVAFKEDMPKYHANWFPEFRITSIPKSSLEDARVQRRFTFLNLFAHNGTHVETSDHIHSNGMDVAQFDLHHFIGFPIILDLRDAPDGAPIKRPDIESKIPNEISEGSVLLLNTGYNDRGWGKSWFWDKSPWLHPLAAEFIAGLRPSLIGLDFQTEKPREKDFVVHTALVSENAIICEYLFNLDKLDPNSLFLALPVKIEGVEASPVRAVGIKLVD